MNSHMSKTAIGKSSPLDGFASANINGLSSLQRRLGFLWKARLWTPYFNTPIFLWGPRLASNLIQVIVKIAEPQSLSLDLGQRKFRRLHVARPYAIQRFCR